MDQLIRSILDLSTSPLSRHSCRVTTTPRLGRAELRSVAAGIAGMALVGGSVGISRTLVAAPLLTAQAIRYSAASAVLLMLARCRGARITRPRGWEWLWLSGVSATGLVLFNIAIVRGVARTGPAMIAVAVACVPVLLGVLGPLLLRRAPRWQVVLAAVIVVAGAVLVEGTGRADAAGVAWAAVALACEASFTLLAVPVLARHGAWGVSVHSVWIGAAMLIVLSGATEGPAAAAQLTAAELAAVAYLAILVTVVAFVLWYSSVAALGPARVGLLTGIAPVSAALTGMATGSRAPSSLMWAGIAVVMAGLAAGLWSPSRLGRPGAPADSPRRRPATEEPPDGVAAYSTDLAGFHRQPDQRDAYQGAPRNTSRVGRGAGCATGRR
jgi:drug/metabolite transporter (DMT)-like permease